MMYGGEPRPSPKPRVECPVDDETREWIDERWAWLLHQFGGKAVRAARIILPTPEFFPDRYDATEGDATTMLERVCGYMGVDAATVMLCVYHARDSEEGAGPYDDASRRFRIWVEVSLLNDPLALIATMAYELAGVHLLGHRRAHAHEEDLEPLTNLLTVFFGLGVISANSVIRESSWNTGGWSGWSMQRHGYLTMPMYGYALARFAHEREERSSPWSRELRKDVRSAFEQGLRYLEEVEPDGPAECPEDGIAPAAPVPRPGRRQAKVGLGARGKPRCTTCGARLKRTRGAERDSLMCPRCHGAPRTSQADRREQAEYDADGARARKIFLGGLAFTVVAVALTVVIQIVKSWFE